MMRGSSSPNRLLGIPMGVAGIPLASATRPGARLAARRGMLFALVVCFACLTALIPPTSENVATAAESNSGIEAETTEASAFPAAEAQPAAIRRPLTSCEGTYDSEGNVTAVGLRLTLPSGLHRSFTESSSEMDVWAADDGLSYLYLYTKDYGEIVTRDNVDTAFGPHYDAMVPEMAEKMGAEVISQGLVVNDWGRTAYVARLIGRNVGNTRVDLDIFLISIPAPDTVLLVIYTAPNGVYDLEPTVDAIVRTIAPEGTAVEASVERPAHSRTALAGETDLDSTMTIGDMALSYSSSWVVRKSDGVTYFYPNGASNAMVIVENPENVASLLAIRDPQRVLEDFLDGMVDTFDADYRFGDVSLGEPSFSTSGTVTTMTALIQFTMLGQDYAGIAHASVSNSTLYAFAAVSTTDQITRYQPVFQKVWESVTIPGADVEVAAEPSRRPVISGGWSSGSASSSDDANSPGDANNPGDAEGRSGGRSRPGAKAGTGGGMALKMTARRTGARGRKESDRSRITGMAVPSTPPSFSRPAVTIVPSDRRRAPMR